MEISNAYEMDVKTWEQSEMTVQLLNTLLRFKICNVTCGRGLRYSQYRYVNYVYAYFYGLK